MREIRLHDTRTGGRVLDERGTDPRHAVLGLRVVRPDGGLPGPARRALQDFMARTVALCEGSTSAREAAPVGAPADPRTDLSVREGRRPDG